MESPVISPPLPGEQPLDEPLSFKGFDIEQGDYKILVVLKPQNAEQVDAPPKIAFGCKEEDWKTWIKQAILVGLQRGTLLDPSDEVLSGFSVWADVPEKENKQRVALLFSQVFSVFSVSEVADTFDAKYKQAKQTWVKTQRHRAQKKVRAKLLRQNRRGR